MTEVVLTCNCVDGEKVCVLVKDPDDINELMELRDRLLSEGHFKHPCGRESSGGESTLEKKKQEKSVVFQKEV